MSIMHFSAVINEDGTATVPTAVVRALQAKGARVRVTRRRHVQPHQARPAQEVSPVPQQRSRRPAGPSLVSRAGTALGEYQKHRKETAIAAKQAKLEGKATEHEINEKQKGERIAAERTETQKTLKKQELRREAQQQEKRELAEKLRAKYHLPAKGQQKPSIAPAPRIVVPPRKERKIDTGDLTAARQEWITK
jgi:hypothetical protein